MTIKVSYYAKIEWRLEVRGRPLFFDIGCCLSRRRCGCSEMPQPIAACLNRLVQPRSIVGIVTTFAVVSLIICAIWLLIW